MLNTETSTFLSSHAVHLQFRAYCTVTVDTHPQNWHLPFSLFLYHMHACNTFLHRETCCVLSGAAQMAATWSVLVGACEGCGQDMVTHTDGDPLRVDVRWTCRLLICPDQWFTTWSSDPRGAVPTEVAHWLCTFGTHHSICGLPSFQ